MASAGLTCFRRWSSLVSRRATGRCGATPGAGWFSSWSSPPTRGDSLQLGLEEARSDPARKSLAEKEVGAGRRLPASTRDGRGRFVADASLFPNFVDHNQATSYLRFRRDMLFHRQALPSPEVLDSELPVRAPCPAALEGGPPAGRAQMTWLGHASVLTQWEGWTVLSDPIFSERCFPVSWAGPKRMRPSPVTVAELPRVDVVVISHNHYDHLDLPTVEELRVAQPEALFMVPLGVRAWFEEAGLGRDNIVEMDWGEEVTLVDDEAAVATREGARGGGGDSVGGGGNGSTARTEGLAGRAAGRAADPVARRPPLTVACVPCQHWGTRTIFDTNKALWCSWLCKTDSLTYFFGGDTGYCGDVFRRTRQVYGDVDLAAIPIAAYGVPEERWFHQANHMDPEEAMKCHVDLGARQSVAIHWGTFVLTGECVLEPPKRLAAAAAAERVAEGSFVCLGHGETMVFDQALLRESEAAADGGRKNAGEEEQGASLPG